MRHGKTSLVPSLSPRREESGPFVSVWEGGELGVEALIDIRIQPISVSKQVTSSKCDWPTCCVNHRNLSGDSDWSGRLSAAGLVEARLLLVRSLGLLG